MKNWIKNLYKLYLAAFAVILFFIVWKLAKWDQWEVGSSLRSFDIRMQTLAQKYPELSQVALTDEVIWPISDLIHLFFDSFKKVLLFGFVLLHAFILWGEKSAEQREFLATLPAKKHGRKAAAIVMDIMLTFSTIMIAAVSCYFYIGNIYAKYDLHMPWLAGSICGLAVTTACYMMALLGIMHVIESLVVRGDMKIIVMLACLAMIHWSVENLFYLSMYDKKNILHEIYGYVNLCMVGGSYYGYNGSWDWLHKPVDICVEYKGETGITGGINDLELFRLVNFSNAGSYIWYALSYLLIGIALIALAIYLVKRQELSKSGFYFHSGVTLVGLLIGTTFFSCVIMFSYALWNDILITIASVIIFAGFVYFVDKKTGQLRR